MSGSNDKCEYDQLYAIVTAEFAIPIHHNSAVEVESAAACIEVTAIYMMEQLGEGCIKAVRIKREVRIVEGTPDGAPIH